MANIGAIDEIVNNENLLLQAGSDTFILMQDCRFNLDRPISRQTTSGGGVVYFFGSGDNSIDFTLLLSTPEMEDNTSTANTLIGLTKRLTNGNLYPVTWHIKATDVSGTTKTIEFGIKIIQDNGKVHFASHPNNNSYVKLKPFDLIAGKNIYGSWGGSSDPQKIANSISENDSKMIIKIFKN